MILTSPLELTYVPGFVFSQLVVESIGYICGVAD